MRMTFRVPLWLLQHDLFVFYWDQRLNEGRGGWVLLELDETDPLTGRVSLYIYRTGLYLLVVRAQQLPLDCLGQTTLDLPNGDRLNAACAPGGTLRVWPVIPHLLPPALEQRLKVGWETAVVGLPPDAMVPLELSLALKEDDRIDEVLLHEWSEGAYRWSSYEHSLRDGRVIIVSPHLGDFLLLFAP